MSVWLLVTLVSAFNRLQYDARNLHKNPTEENKREYDASSDIFKGLTGAIGTLATIFGGGFVFWNILLTQTRLVTERFSKAVEQLGSDKLEVRLGGIYALERIAQDSDRDHWTIMEVLTSFVREKSPLKTPSEEQIRAKAYEIWKTCGQMNSPDKNWKAAIEKLSPKITEDIQAALIVIGRRKIENDPSDKKLDLNKTNLQVADLSHANLQGVKLFFSNLQGAKLVGAKLQGASLNGANLQRASLNGANLQGADLFAADLQEANLSIANLQEAFEVFKANLQEAFKANLQKANLGITNLQKANLAIANLQGANLSIVNLQEADLFHANLQQADLSRANLQGAVLSDADLQGANLAIANLQRADLSKANLQEAKLFGANLQRAVLLNANLQGTILQEAQLDKALLCKTTLMDGTVSDRDCETLKKEGFAID